MITLIVPKKELDKVAQKHCKHYWVIESPHGEVSKGVCKYCEKEKKFFNSIAAFQLSKPYDFSHGRKKTSNASTTIYIKKRSKKTTLEES